jgi:hypothetical protein
MSQKRLIYLALAVVGVFVVWKNTSKPATGPSGSGGVLAFLGLTTPTPTPRSPQPQNGSQSLQQSPAPSNLATLFPPDIFGPMADLG